MKTLLQSSGLAVLGLLLEKPAWAHVVMGVAHDHPHGETPSLGGAILLALFAGAAGLLLFRRLSGLSERRAP